MWLPDAVLPLAPSANHLEPGRAGIPASTPGPAAAHAVWKRAGSGGAPRPRDRTPAALSANTTRAADRRRSPAPSPRAPEANRLSSGRNNRDQIAASTAADITSPIAAACAPRPPLGRYRSATHPLLSHPSNRYRSATDPLPKRYRLQGRCGSMPRVAEPLQRHPGTLCGGQPTLKPP